MRCFDVPGRWGLRSPPPAPAGPHSPSPRYGPNCSSSPDIYHKSHQPTLRSGAHSAVPGEGVPRTPLPLLSLINFSKKGPKSRRAANHREN